MSKRSIAVTAAIAGAAALAATGINYAAAAGTEAAPAAPAVRQAAAPLGGDSGQGKEKEDNDYGHGGGYRHEGRIHFNERSYSSESDGCITVVSGLGSNSFNVRNDSRKTVEVFRGATCDNGSPIATVGPWSTSNSVSPHKVRGGVFVKNGVVGSFRVVEDHHDGGGYGGGNGGGGGKGSW